MMMLRSSFLCLLLIIPGSSNAFQPLVPASSFVPSRSRTLASTHHALPSKSNKITKLHSLADIDAFWQTNPYTAGALICAFKASMADVVAQVQEFKKENEIEGDEDDSNNAVLSSKITNNDKDIDVPIASFWSSANYKRNAAFVAYGALYQGITQEFFYNHLYPIWFGTDTGIETVLTKVTFTLLVMTTLLTLPSLYASKALMEGFSLQQALEQYIYDIQNQQLLQKFYLLWGPVLCLTFSVIPEHYRVTFVAAISFFWLIILSQISSNERPNSETEEDVVVGSTSASTNGAKFQDQKQ